MLPLAISPRPSFCVRPRRCNPVCSHSRTARSSPADDTPYRSSRCHTDCLTHTQASQDTTLYRSLEEQRTIPTIRTQMTTGVQEQQTHGHQNNHTLLALRQGRRWCHAGLRGGKFGCLVVGGIHRGCCRCCGKEKEIIDSM